MLLLSFFFFLCMTAPLIITAALQSFHSFFIPHPPSNTHTYTHTPPPPEELKPISIAVLPWVSVSEAGILPLWSQGWLTSRNYLFNSAQIGLCDVSPRLMQVCPVFAQQSLAAPNVHVPRLTVSALYLTYKTKNHYIHYVCDGALVNNVSNKCWKFWENWEANDLPSGDYNRFPFKAGQ